MEFLPEISHRTRRSCLLTVDCSDNFIGRANAAHSWKDRRAGVSMLFCRQGIHRIFCKHLMVAVGIGFTSRCLDTEIGSNATQDNGIHTSATQLEIEIGAKECAP